MNSKHWIIEVDGVKTEFTSWISARDAWYAVTKGILARVNPDGGIITLDMK